MNKINEIFASNVFSDAVMKERLPKATYKALKKYKGKTEHSKNGVVIL